MLRPVCVLSQRLSPIKLKLKRIRIEKVKKIITLSCVLITVVNRITVMKNFFHIQERYVCNQHTPLHIYNATPYSKKSINHRLFYINWIFVFVFLDFCNSHLDI
ncbi:hypothetical protein YYE_00420 [Plasmodium vinckei vinckei]|nr:hypothetical protein YYE_00420 [Plasmodium vinckei vinckei]